MKEVLLSSFCRWGNESLGKQSILPRVTQLINGRTSFRIELYLTIMSSRFLAEVGLELERMGRIWKVEEEQALCQARK